MQFKSSIRQRRYNYLIANGFYPSEATQLSRTTRNGMSAPYFRRMVKSRRRTVDNLKRIGKTPNQIKDFIKNQYIKNDWLKRDSLGRVKADVWKLLRDQEDKARKRGEEYESPWRGKIKKKTVVKKKKRRVTRIDMIDSLIAQKKRQIAGASNANKRLKYEDELFGYEQQKRKLLEG